MRQYFRALARGDAASALGYGTVPAGDHSYLSAEVLQAELLVAPITDVAIVSGEAPCNCADTLMVGLVANV